MSINFTTPITGAAQTGFTTPTYTIAADTPPKNGAKQWVVTALGGTQTGANIHTASSPFTMTVEGPVNFQPAPTVTINGVTKPVPMNRYVIRTRKGGSVTSQNDKRIAMIESVILVPAGMDLYGPAEIRALVSAHIGGLSQVPAGIGDTGVQGST